MFIKVKVKAFSLQAACQDSQIFDSETNIFSFKYQLFKRVNLSTSLSNQTWRFFKLFFLFSTWLPLLRLYFEGLRAENLTSCNTCSCWQPGFQLKLTCKNQFRRKISTCRLKCWNIRTWSSYLFAFWRVTATDEYVQKASSKTAFFKVIMKCCDYQQNIKLCVFFPKQIWETCYVLAVTCTREVYSIVFH